MFVLCLTRWTLYFMVLNVALRSSCQSLSQYQINVIILFKLHFDMMDCCYELWYFGWSSNRFLCTVHVLKCVNIVFILLPHPKVYIRINFIEHLRGSIHVMKIYVFILQQQNIRTYGMMPIVLYILHQLTTNSFESEKCQCLKNTCSLDFPYFCI